MGERERGSHRAPRRRGRTTWAGALTRTAAAILVGVVLVTVLHAVISRDVDARPADPDPQTPAAPPGRPFTSLVDRIGVSRDTAQADVDLDGAGHSLSAQALATAGWTPGREITLLGTTLELPDYAPGRPDHLVADGQEVRLDGRYGSLTFLLTATGAGGAPVTGTGRVVYTDGTGTALPLTAPDWVAGPAGGASLVLPYANSREEGGPSGTLGSVRLYARSVPVDPTREISHVVLPRVEAGNLHVFSVGGRAADEGWTGTWTRATSGYLEVGPWQDQTLRLPVRTTTGGHRVRIRLDNTFAAGPVTIGSASLALRDGGGAGTLGSAVPLTFDGRPDVSIPAGGQVFSDPVDMLLPPQTDVLVGLYLPDPVVAAPVHYAAGDTGYLSEPGGGDQTLDTTGFPFTGRLYQWPFLTGVEVLDGPGAIVTLGDSITDGARSTRDGHTRWPDVLSARLHARTDLPHLGVLNAGIAGNHVVRDAYPGEGVSINASGVSLLHRAPRDVFGQSGVTTVVIFAGINDLRWGTPPEQVIAGLEELAVQSRDRGLRVFVATLGPCAGEARCTPRVDAARRTVNDHLLSRGSEASSPFDGVWDFDAVLRDPEDPARLLPAYDSGDHIHPGDAGLRALAESVDLDLLTGRPRVSGDTPDDGG
ncbi:SGNH/GDSL hydrolase family protein [Nocardiopsis sp. N85]|uniref:SGNH/GDSL hydrolase family protein n=1 Tax=Nocardiopsis sp. N85 TaxID=3029400 RepID=UPI00237F05AA|nr:SGNH/GDSL hydrolase family protein [Nocardiopsis sp. N85]MDE3720148.1 SGNH/GDSL hydrolase family protein [Nocardiopsis sp. N85]